ncbi:hypothetical protein CHY08_27230 (plasmid) [Rhizobium leguminosarum bv. viciae]|uniref:hypothetical protein n=1 Tax=Rhizobium leguminosarum TaxID=384 RepID=UPI000B8CE8AB|nr:hypothetical protein [Rhizobium leguminosarum]ASR10775.1 hypothetical protein CHY08_27230 [Rhizobium leguminosarum bv. viciae]
MTLSLLPDPKVTNDAIKERLFTYASRHAERFGYRFGEGAESDVRNAAGHAASTINERVGKEKKPDRRELYVRQTESAFEFLVERMIFEALTNKKIHPGPPGIIGEQTFERARALLCPCWPICTA